MMNYQEKLLNLLKTHNISKPSRYIGGELGNIIKAYSTKMVRIALVFPDIYEIGFSNIGLKILYYLINSFPQFIAERAYVPWIDAEVAFKKNNLPLLSYDTYTPLKEFDVIGFSLQYELSYTNILTAMYLAGIPFWQKERDARYPIIIAGGGGAFQPEPIAPFMDLFVIGEGEEVIIELLTKIKEWKENKSTSRQELLKELAKIQGIYVPSLYRSHFNTSGEFIGKEPLENDIPAQINKRVIKDFDSTFSPEQALVPLREVVHNRISVEIFRGCTRGCRFCQAGYIYRPVRERKVSTCLALIDKLILSSGYSEVSLSSLSSSDYSAIEVLLKSLIKLYRSQYISFSLPSLRVDTFVRSLGEEIKQVRKTGITLVPEAGSERLRKVINKNITDEDIFNSLTNIGELGWKKVKLYFMLGLPTEELEDIYQLVDLLKKVIKKGKKAGIKDFRVSISTFIPKPHTPFQWEALMEEKDIMLRRDYINKALSNYSNLHMEFHPYHQSWLETIMTRGDERLAEVIERCWQMGARFDSWKDRSNFTLWDKAFLEKKIEPAVYLKNYPTEASLPWDHINSGVTKEFLLKEREKAFKCLATYDCRTGKCNRCGVCEEYSVRPLLYPQPEIVIKRKESFISNNKVVERIRVRYRKQGEMVFISHLELMELFKRAIRRAAIPISFTEGFSPHPRISPAVPLATGMKGEEEWMDLYLCRKLGPFELVHKLQSKLFSSIEITGAWRIPIKSESLMSIITLAYYRATGVLQAKIDDVEELKGFLKDLMKRSEIKYFKEMYPKEDWIDLKNYIRKFSLVSLKDDLLTIRCMVEIKAGTPKLQKILESIFGKDFIFKELTREKLLIEKDGMLLNPAGELVKINE